MTVPRALRVHSRLAAGRLMLAAVAAALVLPACAAMQSAGILVPPEPGVLPEYSQRIVQHRVLTVLWRVPLMKAPAEPVERHEHGGAAVSSDGLRVFVGSQAGAFLGLDARTGKVLWRKLLEGPFDARPLATEGMVYAGSGGGVLYALRETDGEVLWSFKSNVPMESQPVIVGDNLLVASDTNTVFCLNAQTGDWRWSYTRDVPPGRFQVKGVSRPTVVGEHVYVGFSDGAVAKLALADGSVEALRMLGDKNARFTDVDTDPLPLDDGSLVVASFAGGIDDLAEGDLAVRWSYKVLGASDMIHRGDRLYYTTADANVECLNLKDHKLFWRFRAGEGALSRPVLAGGRFLLVSSSVQSLLILDRLDGKLLQVFNPGKGSGSTPTLAGDRVYWISNGQTLYCMSLAH